MNKRNSVIIAAILLLLIGTGSFVFANPSEEDLYVPSNNQNEGTRNDSNSNSTNNGNSSNNNQNRPSSESNSSVILEPSVEENNVNTPNENNTYTQNSSLENFGTSNNTVPVTPSNPITPIVPENPKEENPSNPTEPENPKEENPSNPTEPENPKEENPSNPTEPENPKEENPSKPTEPENPKEENPSNPTEPEANDQELINKILKLIDELKNNKKEENISQIKEEINKVKDKEQQNKLTDELNKIISIIDVIKKIEELEELLNNSKNKKDIENIQKQIEESNIIKKIEELETTEEITNQKEKLDSILNIINDTSAPAIKGLPLNNITNQNVSLTIEDETNITILLNDKEVTLKDLENITEEKIYHLIVTDEAWNKEEVTFKIDKTAPEASLEYSTTTITKEDVTVTLKSNEDIIITNNDGADTYTFSENGSFTFTFKDKAGNTATKEANIDFIDKTAPTYKKLGILNKSRYQTDKDKKVANKEEEIVVFVTFEEELAIMPTILLNNIELNTKLNKELSTENNYIYEASYIIDDETEEGDASILIKDYTDKANNETQILTNENINSEEYNEIYIIKEPGLELIENGAFNNGNIVIKEPGFSYMKIYNWWTWEEVYVFKNTYTLPSYDTYTITVYNDKDEIIKTATMTYDVDAPTISAKGTIDGKTEKIVAGKSYDSVSIKVTDDNAIHQIKRIMPDGSYIILEENKISDENVYSSSINFTESGEYSITAVDKAGNEKTVTFIIK